MAIIPCRSEFDLKKKNLKKKKENIHLPAPTPKTVLEDNKTIVFLG